MMGRRPTLDVRRRSHAMTQPDTLIDALDSFESRSRDSTATGAQAFGRLL